LKDLQEGSEIARQDGKTINRKKKRKTGWSDGHAVFAEVILLQALADVACGDSVDSAPSVRTEA
jgi:hypothetical protein